MTSGLLFLWILLIVQSAVPTVNTDRTNHDVYTVIPQAERQEFRTAVDNLIALEKAGTWGDVYDQFYLNDQGETKEHFVHQRDHLQVRSFLPIKIYYVPPFQAWVISGCAVFSPPLPLLKTMSSGVISDVTAKHTARGWRFDAPPAVTIYRDSTKGPRPCTA